jgi:hypothetical protein
VVSTRRALLGAGALALLAGCGPPDEPEPDVSVVLGEQLRAELRVVAAYEGVDDAKAAALARRARERVRRLEEAGAAAATTPPASASGLEAALEAERAALEAHVQAVGLLESREHRELLAELIAGAAAHESALLTLLGRPPSPSAFPGQPT